MPEYIDRQAAKDTIKKEWDGCAGQYECWQIILDTCVAIDELQPADVRPVVRAKWILEENMFGFLTCECSNCGEITRDTVMGKPKFKYCPMCGATMEYNNA